MADAKGEGSIQKGVALTKDVFSLLRDATLFVGFVLLLFFPAFVNQALSTAGIVQIKNGVFTWERQLGASTDNLQDAKNTISNLQVQIQNLNDKLTSGNLKAITPDQQKAIESARSQAQNATTAASQIQQTLQAQIQANAAFLAWAEEPKLKAIPDQAYCYQEQDGAKPEAQRYAMICHATKSNCDTVRGPNPKTVQSACTLVSLKSAPWSPRSGGLFGSWYQYSSAPFPGPFPALPQH